MPACVFYLGVGPSPSSALCVHMALLGSIVGLCIVVNAEVVGRAATATHAGRGHRCGDYEVSAVYRWDSGVSFEEGGSSMVEKQ